MNDAQRIARLGVAVSASLAVLKILIGVLSGSNALLADGFESAGDLLSSTLILIGLVVAARPADSNHPYGHGRAETLSGLAIGMMLIFGGLAIAAEALATAGSVRKSPAFYAIWPLIVSISIKLWMLRLKYVTGKRIGSSALLADSMNDGVDAFSGIVALCALSLTLMDPEHFLRADHYGAIAVGLIMVGTGFRVAHRTGLELMDTMPDSRFVDQIRHVAVETPGVAGVEKLFARKTGLSHHVDVHVEVNPALSVRASHEIAHRVEDQLMRDVPGIADVFVHIEPARVTPPTIMSFTKMKLPDVTLGVTETQITQEPFGEVRMYFEGPTDYLKTMTAGSLILNAGMSPHPPHRHPEEEFMLVTEGTGEILVDDQVKQVGPGAQMYCAANKLHGITNTGTTPMLFYFYKWLA